MKKRKGISKIFIYLFLFIVLIITLFPLIYTIASSFKTNMEIMAYPERIFSKNPTLSNYVRAWNSETLQIGRMFINSVLFSASCVIIMLLTSSMYGYVFARGDFPGKNLVFVLFSSLMFVSIGSITVYPLLEILSTIGLKSSLWALIVYKIFCIPMVYIYLVKGFIDALPRELDEAAVIDGCSFITTFARVIAPLLKPIIATVTVMAFQSSWNEYLLPAVFTATKREQQTLIVGVMALKTAGEGAASWDLMLAGSTLAILPILVVFAICNKQFVKAVAAGAVKG